MKKRLLSLRRIVDIKEQKRQSATMRLARLEAAEREALREEAEIFAALNDEQPLHGLFCEVMARHLRAIAERLDAIRLEKAEETARLQKETGELRHSERMLITAERQHARDAEGRALFELIDAAAARGGASLPKAS